MHEHIKFLNHSSFIISSPKTKILCDPWFHGTAFGDGWSLLHDRSHQINELEFDYIWISHEHPDHFSIPTLSDLKHESTFLFQETQDKKVKRFLESKGHSVIELLSGETQQIGDLELTCIVCDGFDSSLLVRFPDNKLLLNINDARVELDSHLTESIEPLLTNDTIDLLAFQFSYANWAGNRGDKDTPQFLQERKDGRNDEMISRLKPKAILPFASFVYFSHEENFFWNDSNWLEHTFERLSAGETTLIFPEPDQSISLDYLEKSYYQKTNQRAFEFWRQKHQNLSVKNSSQLRSLDEIKESYVRFNRKLNEENGYLALAREGEDVFINIRVIDLDTTVKCGLSRSSFREVNEEEAVSVSSETLCFLFSQPFARGTVFINGRISFNYQLAHTFFLFFFIPYANNVGIFFSPDRRVERSMLNSIFRNSVMNAISNSQPGIPGLIEREIDSFVRTFSPVNELTFEDDIFNQEPQNELL